MSYESIYSLEEINNYIGKALASTLAPYGWILYQEEDVDVINVDNITEPGNYYVSKATSLPSDIIDEVGVNIITNNINGITYQILLYGTLIYARINNSGVYTEWNIIDDGIRLDENIIMSTTEPTAPIEGKTIWVDTTPTDTFFIKVYINGQWSTVSEYTKMLKSVYDPNNMEQDFFAYSDTELIQDYPAVEDNVSTHNSDLTVHTTPEQKLDWNSRANKTYLTSKSAELISRFSNGIIESLVLPLVASLTPSLLSQVDAINDSINAHLIGTTIIHPNAETQADYNSRADKTHTHILDNRVTVGPNNVIGSIPIDPALVVDGINEKAEEIVSGTVPIPEEILQNYQEAVEIVTTHAKEETKIAPGSKIFDKNMMVWLVAEEDGVRLRPHSEITISGQLPVYENSNQIIAATTKQNNVSIVYGNGMYVLLAFDIVLYSTDMVTWQKAILPEMNFIINVAREVIVPFIRFVNNTFVIGIDTYYFKSTDGISWEQFSLAVEINDIVYGNGIYIAYKIANSLNLYQVTSTFLISNDLVTWTSVSSPIVPYNKIVYGNGVFVVPARSINFNTTREFSTTDESEMYYSSDGTSWNRCIGNYSRSRIPGFVGHNLQTVREPRFAYTIAFNGNNFVAIPSYYGNKIAAVSSTAQIIRSTGADSLTHGLCYISNDGIIWNRISHIDSTSINQSSYVLNFESFIEKSELHYNGNYYFGCYGTGYIYSKDLSKWKYVPFKIIDADRGANSVELATFPSFQTDIPDKVSNANNKILYAIRTYENNTLKIIIYEAIDDYGFCILSSGSPYSFKSPIVLPLLGEGQYSLSYLGMLEAISLKSDSYEDYGILSHQIVSPAEYEDKLAEVPIIHAEANIQNRPTLTGETAAYYKTVRRQYKKILARREL